MKTKPTKTVKSRSKDHGSKPNHDLGDTVFSYGPTPGWIFDSTDFHVLAANEAACRKYGYSQEEFLALTLKEIIHDDDHSFVEQFEQNRINEDWITFHGKLVKKGGGRCEVECLIRRIIYREKTSYILIARDITAWKMAEDLYAHDSILWKSFMDNIPDAIYFKDRESRFTRINKAEAKILGVVSAAEAIGKTDFDFFYPGHAQRSHKTDQQIISTGQPAIALIEDVMLRDGSRHWYSTTKLPLRNADGVITGIVGSSRDITELKQYETTLSRISAQRKLLLDISQSILSEISLGDVIKNIFAALEQVLAFDTCGLYRFDEHHQVLRPDVLIQPELISTKLQTFSIPYGRGIMGSVLKSGKGELINDAHLDPRSVYPEGVSISCEHMICVPVMVKHKPIGVIFVSRRADPQFNQQEFEMVELFISHMAFAIEHSRLFEQILVSEERYRELFEESRDIVFISDRDGKFKDVNPAGVELFGFDSKEELMKADMREFTYLDNDDQVRYQREIEEKGYIKDFEILVRTKKGQTKVLLQTATPILDENNALTGYRGTMRDITQVKELQERLLQAQKMESLGTLAGGIAHDFNNILSIIIAYTSRLERTELDPAEIAKSIDTIRKASWRGAEIIKQILTFARKTETNAEYISINTAIEDVTRLLKETLPKTVAIELDLATKLPIIKADYNQMHQAIINLCVNARDAMPDGGKITIRTRVVEEMDEKVRFPETADSPFLALSITDTGIGMTEETRGRIFEPFFTTKEQGKGTGLGLAMVYGIIQNHQGFIDVQSRQNKGTTFTLYLPFPLELVERHNVADEAETASHSGKETILVVEDEAMLQDFIKIILTSSGYTVLTADDGNKAVEMYLSHQNEISLVFSDMGLPGLNGWEAIKKMRAVNPKLRVIFATGYLDPEIKNEITRAGVQEFIQKPYRPEEIQKKIREVLDVVG